MPNSVFLLDYAPRGKGAALNRRRLRGEGVRPFATVLQGGVCHIRVGKAVIKGFPSWQAGYAGDVSPSVPYVPAAADIETAPWQRAVGVLLAFF